MRQHILTPELSLLSGAVTTGLYQIEGRTMLIDCCDSITPTRLAALGIDRVDYILFTQHRRPNTAGAYAFVESGTRLIGPSQEAYLFSDVAAYWSDPANRWHVYHQQPGPQVLAEPLLLDHQVGDGTDLAWLADTISVIATPGMTEGSVSYLIESQGEGYCFCGDVIYGPGQVWDLYSLQKGAGEIRDYHSFMGNLRLLKPSLQRLRQAKVDYLIPAHGEPIDQPDSAIDLLLERLEQVWRNYTAISALNYYFPEMFAAGADDPARLTPVTRHEFPPFVRRVAYTSFAIVSQTGAALLIDCGHETVINTLQIWQDSGQISSLEGCWITHYHDDHVDALPQLRDQFDCPMMTHTHLVDLLERPERYFLPCISPAAVTIDRVKQDGETWQWHEFKLTAFHLPAQTLYHNALLVEGYGKRALIAGDAAAPTGIDDYCAGNRNFLGDGRGFRYCVDLWRRLKPDYIFNAHQDLAFSFAAAELDHLETMLIAREKLLSEVSPWSHSDFVTDEHWVRAYPYEQKVQAGQSAQLEVHFTNHGATPALVKVEPVLPVAWQWHAAQSEAEIAVPAQTEGFVGDFCVQPDGIVSLTFAVPTNASPGLTVLPLRVWWGERYLGQFRQALVYVVSYKRNSAHVE